MKIFNGRGILRGSVDYSSILAWLNSSAFDFGGFTPAFELDFVENPKTAQEKLSHERAGNAMMRDAQGRWVWAPHNLVVQSALPTTQTITVVSGAGYTVECTGSGSVALSGAGTGTVSVGNPVTITAGSASLTLTVSGSVDTLWSYRSDMGGMADNPATGNSYVPTTDAPVYLPRIGHHEWDGSEWVNKGLLKEGQATNSQTNSSDISDTNSWTLIVNAGIQPVGSGSLSNVIEAPDGSTSGDFVAETSGSGLHYWYGPLFSDADTKVWSVHLKAGSRTQARIQIGAGSMGQGVYADVDLVSGTITDPVYAGGSYTALKSGTQYCGNGWYRCYVSAVCPAASHVGYISMRKNGAVNYVGDGSGLYQWGAQMESGQVPSSYIPTNGAAVTRAADVMTQPAGTLPWPEPEVIGPELVTNGTFDSDLSGWTVFGDCSVVSGAAVIADVGGTDGAISQQLTGVLSGDVLMLEFEQTSGNDLIVQVGFSAGNNLDGQYSGYAVGSHRLIFVAKRDNPYLTFRSFFTGKTNTIDNISVREIKPLALTIGMSGEVSYSDNDMATEVGFVMWQDTLQNRIYTALDTRATKQGSFQFVQVAGGTLDNVVEEVLSPGLNVPFSFCTTHASTFVAAAVNGTSLTTNTTPTALPDLSATEVELLPTFNGTVKWITYWDKDIGSTGRLEGSSNG